MSVETAERVATFLHEFILKHAAAFYAGTLGLTDDLDEMQGIASYILTAKLEVVTMRACQRGVRAARTLDRWQFQRLMERFESLGWVTQTEPPKNSNTPRWTVNPRVHTLFEQRATSEAQRKAHVREIITNLGVDDKC